MPVVVRWAMLRRRRCSSGAALHGDGAERPLRDAPVRRSRAVGIGSRPAWRSQRLKLWYNQITLKAGVGSNDDCCTVTTPSFNIFLMNTSIQTQSNKGVSRVVWR